VSGVLHDGLTGLPIPNCYSTYSSPGPLQNGFFGQSPVGVPTQSKVFGGGVLIDGENGRPFPDGHDTYSSPGPLHNGFSGRPYGT
jgi:hypothetical protein